MAKVKDVMEQCDGALARRVRKQLGMNQADAGIWGGVGRYTVGRWERDQAPVYYVRNLQNLLVLRQLRDMLFGAVSLFTEEENQDA